MNATTHKVLPAVSLSHWLLLLAVIWVSTLFQLGAVPLFDLDEGAFSEATREMLVSGDYVSTWLNGEPRFDKPVLIHWLQAASVGLFGLNEWALRLPSALAGAATLLILFAFVRRHRDTTTALLAVAMTGLSLNIGLIFKAATADALLIFFLTATLLAIFEHYTQPRKGLLYLIYALMGFGLLTKGPVAVFFPVLISLIFFALNRRWQDWFRAVFFVPGWVLLLVIALPWYVLQYLKMGDAFIDGFFFQHNLSRFDSAMEEHEGSVFYYLPVLLLSFVPFWALLKPVAQQRGGWASDSLRQFSLVWLLSVVVFFSFSGTKLPHYINYGLPGLMIWLSLYHSQLSSSRWLLWPGWLMLALLWLLPTLLMHFSGEVEKPFYRSILANFDQTANDVHWYAWMTGFTLVMLALTAMRWPTTQRLIGSALVVMAAFLTLVLPVTGQLQQGPIKEAALKAKSLEKPAVLWRFNRPSFSFYYRDVTPSRAPEPGELALTQVSKLANIPFAYQVHYQKHAVVLIERLANTGSAQTHQ
ncbi:MAG: glycosyltransferase family 39 protein [Hydrogenovibrio sp.]|uniref:ArnT family glycosyltransferase n=1 Tax=Hydrogenovibrio sp. TaxID=2065821 RepID=UPI002870AA31|nr:glycosyltransferase family 39 protein [Hydrogenovibrio sp.]MDR9498475.1 glycosyltransferase family 39 protein [Hydrogenovibrio sp.]